MNNRRVDLADQPGLDFDPKTAKHIVLIVTEAFPPDPLSGAARPGRFAKFLPQFGYGPIVICRSSSVKAADSLSVRRVPHSTTSRKMKGFAGLCSLIQRYLLPYDDKLPWAAHALAEAEAVLAQRPVDAIYSTSPAIGAHLAALWIKLRHGLPWVADFRDPLWGNPFRSRRWIFSYDERIERALFRQADALVANTDSVAELWRQRHRMVDNKIHTVFNGYDPEDRIEAMAPPAFGRRVLAHVGSLYGGRHPGRLLSSLVRLIGRGELSADRICVRLVGPIEERCLEVNREAVDALRGWGCLEYDGKSIPTAEARRASAQADSLLLLDVNEQAVDLQIPAKLFDYIQIGRPILAYTRRDSPSGRILRNSGVPHRIVDPNTDDDEADRAVREIFDLPVEPRRPSAWFEEQFDGRNQTRVLAEILDRVRDRSFRSPPSPTGARPMNPGHNDR